MTASKPIDFADYRILFEKAPEPMLAVSEDSLDIVAANDRALDLLNSSSAATIGRNLRSVISQDCHERILPLITDRKTPTTEIQSCIVRDSGGADHESDLAISRHDDERVMLIAFHDASVRTRLQEQFWQAQKTDALGMLAGGIAHDFNNLLTIISGYTQMLQSSPHITTERDRTAIEQVLKASEMAAGLTGQLLAFGRRQNVQAKILPINQVVDDTARMLRRLIGENLELRIREAPDAGKIHADAGQIQQLLLNLAINARDAMPNGGLLLIETRNAELDAEDIGQQFGVKPGLYVVLEVADTGIGMDEATRKRAFEPFFTTKGAGKGTGLGLATVYGIVRQCGGVINLYSEQGHGTTIRVYLPRAEMGAPEETVRPRQDLRVAPELQRGGHETILVAEDEEGVRKMVKAALERQGYHVLTAADGSDALRVAATRDGGIDLLVTDMIMPHMNGRELAQRLTDAHPQMGVLFISGYAENSLQTKGACGNEVEFLQKPFPPAALIASVRKVLDAREGRETGQAQGS
jgi:two-component system cell cycle sensor histidine kinase/response regulator CckA